MINLHERVADLGGGWTRDLLVSSRTAHPTEPPRPAKTKYYKDRLYKVSYINLNQLIVRTSKSRCQAYVTIPEDLYFNSFGAKFQTTFVVCFFFFFFFILTNYRLERRLYVKLKNWMSKNVDPDEPSHLDLCYLQKPIIIACDSERVKVNQNTCMLDLRHMKFCFRAYEDSEGPGQPAHRHCLIRTFTVLDSINYINILRYFLVNIFNTCCYWLSKADWGACHEWENEWINGVFLLPGWFSNLPFFFFFYITYTIYDIDIQQNFNDSNIVIDSNSFLSP